MKSMVNTIEKNDSSSKIDLIKEKKKRIFRENLRLFTLTVPGIICLLVFHYLPMSGIVIAFKKYVPRLGIWASPWVGFENFRFFFESQDFVRLVRNTALYGAWFLLIDMITAVLLALAFYHLLNHRALKTYKTIVQVPRFLSIIVISYITYALMSPSYGILNQLITGAGGEAVAWYSNPAYWPFILTIVHVWQNVGGGCLLYYSALLSIDSNLFEAASIDGASTFRKCWHIALPALKPVIALNMTLGIGSIVSADMGLFDAIPRAQGILFPTTDVINTYVYRSLLTGEYARPAAVGLAQGLVATLLVLTANAVVRKISPENAMF